MSSENQMPTYDYECKRCNHIFQASRPMSEYNLPWKCPICTVNCERVVAGTPAFILKGKGFYKNDYGNKKN